MDEIRLTADGRNTLFVWNYTNTNDAVSADNSLQKKGEVTNNYGPVYLTGLQLLYPASAGPIQYHTCFLAVVPEAKNLPKHFQSPLQFYAIGRELGSPRDPYVYPIGPIYWPSGAKMEIHVETTGNAIPARGLSVDLYAETMPDSILRSALLRRQILYHEHALKTAGGKKS